MRFPSHFHRSAFDLAIQQLRDGRAGESGYGRRIALLLTIPTFDDPVARDVRRAATGELYVVRTVWQRMLDTASTRVVRDARVAAGSVGMFGLDIVNSRPPSLRSVRVNVDAEALDALLETVSSATIACRPYHPEPPLDATVFELTFGEELHETRYRWSGAAPDGWAPLATCASRLIRLIDDPNAVAR
jgi:hypothetical protein